MNDMTEDTKPVRKATKKEQIALLEKELSIAHSHIEQLTDINSSLVQHANNGDRAVLRLKREAAVNDKVIARQQKQIYLLKDPSIKTEIERSIPAPEKHKPWMPASIKDGDSE